MEIRQIRQFSRLVGTNRNPDVTEHLGVPRWDNNAGYFTYIKLTTNSKTVEGMVAKGDDSAEGNYIWKLDGSKNPAWRKEQYLVSMQKNPAANDAIFTMNDGTTLSLPLGSLAWSSETLETMAVTSVFGRVGDILPLSGDYTAAQITNAFDVSSDTLGDITEGGGSYHFTTAYKDFIDVLIANGIDGITDIGSGLIVTDAERIAWNAASTGLPETIMDTVAALIQNGVHIKWIYDDPGDTLTGDLDLTTLTSDDIEEGVTNLYFTEARAQRSVSITLPSAASVAARILAAVEGVDYPTGWVLTAGTSPVDLLITHNQNRILNGITVFSIDGLNQERLLVPFSNAYSGILVPDTNSVLIEALSDITTKLRINVTFV